MCSSKRGVREVKIPCQERRNNPAECPRAETICLSKKGGELPEE